MSENVDNTQQDAKPSEPVMEPKSSSDYLCIPKLSKREVKIPTYLVGWTKEDTMSKEYLELAKEISTIMAYVGKRIDEYQEFIESDIKRLEFVKGVIKTLMDNTYTLTATMKVGVLTQVAHSTDYEMFEMKRALAVQKMLEEQQKKVDNYVQ